MSDQVAKLSQSAKAGDLAAASELVNLFYQRIYAYFRRLCGSDQDAEDLTQQVFLRVHEGLDRLEDKEYERSWILSITRRVILNEIRRKKTQKRDGVHLSLEQFDEDLPSHDPSPSPLESALLDEQSSLLQEAIARLPPQQRRSFTSRGQ